MLCNGWGVGTDHYGGYAGEARLQSAWAIPLPAGHIGAPRAQVVHIRAPRAQVESTLELCSSCPLTSPGLSAAQAAQIGTAGYTAMLCVDAVVRKQCFVYYCL